MANSNRLLTALKALSQLGFSRVALYALYRFGLKTGHYKRMTDDRQQTTDNRIRSSALRPLFRLPPREQILEVIGQEGLQALLAEADEIVSGKARPFGADPVPLQLAFSEPLSHWTAYETGQANLRPLASDVKMIWEPARFGWAFTLGRAYQLTGNEKYAGAFWTYFETFSASNPTYFGPNWMSGQEVAFRTMTFIWAAQLFSESSHSTDERKSSLAQAVAMHASRIPPTLVYARSQNNNHLLSEAVGLYTAALALPDHPQAKRWQHLGWKWLTWCLRHQIDSYGEYVQHSTNYHRLMLQLVLWIQAIGHPPFDRRITENLSLATHWLYALLDPGSGHVPNLGANDGAYILPWTIRPFDDHRPVLQAAARAFMNYSLPSGTWDEMALWFGLPGSSKYFEPGRYLAEHLYARNSWGMLRTIRRFRSRPSHADLLHVDLWWRGLNLAQDAGTYLYNADPPWDNALTSTRVHNTVTVDGRDQMNRVSRFLYLDWAHTKITAQSADKIDAYHTGYHRMGVRHERSVEIAENERWIISDCLQITRNLCKRSFTFCLHWMLPDWEWKLQNSGQGGVLMLNSPHGWVTVRIAVQPEPLRSVTSLVRAGEILAGERDIRPWEGWYSPTYGVRQPALSLALEVASIDTVQFTTEFILPV